MVGHLWAAHTREYGAIMSQLKKMMIANLLGRRFEFKSYLELATPSTGSFYSQIDRDYFAHVARMMYVTPFVYDDGMKVDFRSPDEDISGVLEDFRASGRTVDICLVDGWHTYKNANRDLVEMFDLLSDGGVLVVHDCIPESREGASPRFRRGAWWGLSYKAFLDFVLQNPSLDYFALDGDHGCGMIIKNRAFDAVLGQDEPGGWLPPRPPADLVARWFDVKDDADLAYTLFEAEHGQLLRLVPADRFMSLFSDEALELASRTIRPPPQQAKAVQQTNPAPVSAKPKKPNLDTRFLQYLNRKLATMTGQEAPPPKAKRPDGDKGHS